MTIMYGKQIIMLPGATGASGQLLYNDVMSARAKWEHDGKPNSGGA